MRLPWPAVLDKLGQLFPTARFRRTKGSHRDVRVTASVICSIRGVHVLLIAMVNALQEFSYFHGSCHICGRPGAKS